MIGRVSISNFKSIKRLEFEPRRVNVLIGEPNTGKSNVLEALAVFCGAIYLLPEAFRDILRFDTVADLFYDRDLSETIEVRADTICWSLSFLKTWFELRLVKLPEPVNRSSVGLDHKGHWGGHANVLAAFLREVLPVRYYRYRSLASFTGSEAAELAPPYGENLATLLTINKRLRHLVGDLFRARGFRLVIYPEQNKLLLAKEVHDQLFQFSYPTASETLRRIVFFMAVLETNQNAILLLDEPEANTFPFYTTYLAERIALDETNQFFLTTHNPYVLGALVAKTPAQDLAVWVATMEGYQTQLKPVTETGLARIGESGPDAFLNLERLTTA